MNMVTSLVGSYIHLMKLSEVQIIIKETWKIINLWVKVNLNHSKSQDQVHQYKHHLKSILDQSFFD